MDSAVIKSASSSATLISGKRDDDYFTVTFESPSVKLRKRAWGYTDCEFLVNLFKFIAKEWKGYEIFESDLSGAMAQGGVLDVGYAFGGRENKKIGWWANLCDSLLPLWTLSGHTIERTGGWQHHISEVRGFLEALEVTPGTQESRV